MNHKVRCSFSFLFFFLLIAVSAFSQERSLRFYGNGNNDIDRVKIPIDNPPRPVDVGDDFTIEFWMKANLSNNSGSVDCSSTSGGDRWITGNIIFDRDVYGSGDYGDYGISLSNGRIVFGVDAGAGSITLCGTSNVADGVWHHIAVTRRKSDGQMQIFVDGVREAVGNGGTGDASYRDGRQTNYSNDPFLVIGAEKHDAGSAYPSYNGFIDEIRISNNVRYTANFTRPTTIFSVDANTVALYHLNEGTGNTVGDALGSSNGTINFGGSPQGPVWSTESPFTPTASVAEISGKVRRSDGLPLANIQLDLRNLNTGELFSTLTDEQGNYVFPSVNVGFTYTLIPRSVHYTFSPSDQTFFHIENRPNTDFVGYRRRKRH